MEKGRGLEALNMVCKWYSGPLVGTSREAEVVQRADANKLDYHQQVFHVVSVFVHCPCFLSCACRFFLRRPLGHFR